MARDILTIKKARRHGGTLRLRSARAPARRARSLRASRGFSLAESMIAVVILAVAVTAVAGVLHAARSQSAITADASTAQELARQLMEEITSRPYADPDGPSRLGPEAGETQRVLFDNVDDYHAYADTLVREQNTKYERSVAVAYRAARDGAAIANVGDFALVTVTVQGPESRPVVLSQLVTSATTRR